MAKLTLAQLKSHLFSAADILRRRLNSSDCIEFTLAMLFLKRASDLFSERRRQLLKEKIRTGHSQKSAENIVETPEPYGGIFFVPPEARWSHLRENAHHDLGHHLNRALRSIEHANPSLEGALLGIDFTRVARQPDLADLQLRELIDHFDSLCLDGGHLGERDLLGSACDALLDRLATSPAVRSELFRTSRELTRIMVQIANPTEGMHLYDPCCGTGGMLVASHQYVNREASSVRLYGHDLNGKACSIARLNAILHGIADVNIIHADALFHPVRTREGKEIRFDRVLTNPPLGRRRLHTRAELPPHLLPVSSTDLLFAQHVASALGPGGLGAIITTYSSLYHGGREQAVREGLVENDQIEAVIGLGSGLLPYTRIPVCILIIRARNSKPAERAGRVLFIDASSALRTSEESKRPAEEQVEEILEIWRHFVEVRQLARVVELAEIASHSFDLNPQRWQLSWQLERVREIYPEFRVCELRELASEIRTVRKGATRSQEGNFIYFARNAKPLLEEDLFDADGSARTACFRAALPASTLPGYLHAFLDSDLGCELVESVRFGTPHGVTNLRGLQRLTLAVPDLQTQQGIVGTRERLRTFRLHIDKLHTRLAVDLSDYAAVNERVSQGLGLIRAVAIEGQVQWLITQGESSTLEFKESLGWDAKTNRKNRFHMEAALKAVVAFLNADGGHLLVGVTNQGEPVGMGAEIEATYGSPDRLLLAWTNSLRDRVGTNAVSLTDARIVTVRDQPIMFIKCKAAGDPCFLDDKHFLVRLNASSQQLEGRRLVEYVQSTFPR